MRSANLVSSGILYMINYEFVECVHILQILLIRHLDIENPELQQERLDTRNILDSSSEDVIAGLTSVYVNRLEY